MDQATIILKTARAEDRSVLTYSIGDPEKAGRSASLALGAFSYGELFDLAGVPRGNGLRRAEWDPRALFAQSGGWQSWSAGWELAWNETLPRRVLAVPELLKYTNRPGDDPGPGELVAHFILRLRVGDEYLCLASREGGALPPTSFRLDRRSGRVSVEAWADGKRWRKGEKAAEIVVFRAEGFFALKDALRSIYEPEKRFGCLDFLRGEGGPLRPGGWESWYNHYTDIDQELIRADLEALGKTDNLIDALYLKRGKPAVFQIDDGWQRAVGEWEIDGGRFPDGLRPLADGASDRGLVPGLWLAPFIVTRKAALFREKPEWLLRDEAGEPVVAGYNDKWDKRFYCLDLSRPEVADYLRSLIDRAIDKWGFRYLKLDFLYAGMLPGARANGGAVYEHYDRAVRLLVGRKKDRRGRPVAYLGCGLPLGPSYPYFPLSRIGADTKEDWDWPLVRLIGHVGRPSAYVNLLDTIGRAHLDGTVYVNDPDVVFLREKNCRLSESGKELVAVVNRLLASQIMISDDPAEFGESAAERALTERIAALYDELPDDEYGATRIDRDVFRLESRSGAVSGLLNLRRTPYRLRRDGGTQLFDDLARGATLVDRRLGFRGVADAVGRGRLDFAPRSATLVRV